MGGDDSQKLLLWRGAYSSPGRKPPAHYEFNTVTENCRRDLARATSPASQPRYVAQLQTAWVIFGKQTWVTSPARRRIERWMLVTGIGLALGALLCTAFVQRPIHVQFE